MKNKKTELDVDFIGGHDLLTEKDFQRVTAIIKAERESKTLKIRKPKAVKKRKVNSL